jgi:hypothetical protein
VHFDFIEINLSQILRRESKHFDPRRVAVTIEKKLKARLFKLISK